MTPISAILIVALVAALLFSLAPGLDLWVAGEFYRPGAGFWLSDIPALMRLRLILWDTGLVVFFAALIGLAVNLSLRARREVRPGFWLRGVLTMLLGPGVVVNLYLKEYWGRARPVQITEFGGAAHFTPALRMTDQCLRNCSFASGEGSLAVAAALVLYWLVSPLCNPVQQRVLLVVCITYAVLTAGMRVLFGGHFLSDVIFAALISSGIWLLLGMVPGLGANSRPDRQAMFNDYQTATGILRRKFQFRNRR